MPVRNHTKKRPRKFPWTFFAATRTFGGVFFFFLLSVVVVLSVPRHAQAARLWSSGFEMGTSTQGVEGEFGSPAKATSTVVHSGSYAARLNGFSSFTSIGITVSSTNLNGPYFVRTYLYVTTLPTASNTIMALRSSGGVRIVFIKLDSTGKLILADEDGQIGSSTALSLNSWYRVEVQYDRTGAGGFHVARARLDGVEFAGAVNRNLSSGINRFSLGANISTEAQTVGDWYFDDVAMNDNAGSYQNTFPGEGKIVHLRPNGAGDNAMGTRGGANTGSDWGQLSEVTPDSAGTYYILDVDNDIIDVNIDAASVAGMSATDIISLVQVGIRERAATAAAEGWKVRIKSQGGGTVLSSATTTHDDITWKTNGDIVSHIYPLTAYVDPQAGGAWTTALLDNSQIGVLAGDATPDVWVSTLWALVEYTTPPRLEQIHYRWRNDDGGEGAGGGSWHDFSWNYRQKITVQSSKVSSPQSNFPVYLDLADMGNDFWAHVGSTCGDIRMTSADGITEIPRELVSCSSTAKTGEVHFKAPSLASATNTDFYAYFGNSGASDYASSATYGANNVWDSNYKGVWHFEESLIDEGSTTDVHADSTSNPNDGDQVGEDDGVGKIGRGIKFDGTNDTVNANSDASLDNIAVKTASFWVKRVDNTRSQGIVQKGAYNASGNGWIAEIRSNSGSGADTIRYAHRWSGSAGGGATWYGSTALSDLNAWYYATIVYDSGSASNNPLIYVNGSAETVGELTAPSGTEGDDNASNLEFGINQSTYSNSEVDEVRISNIARSASWVMTDYNNQSSPSTFYTTSTVEASSSGTTWAAAEDQPIFDVPKQTTRRLRFEISNEGVGVSVATQYRIEYATSSGASTWTQIGTGAASTNHWVMTPSQLVEGANTTDVAGGLNNENTTFVAGRQLETSNQSAAITLASTEFTELEYSIAATSTAIAGQTYYFRLTNAGAPLDAYTIYASATLAAAASPNLTQIHYRWRNDDGGEGIGGGGGGSGDPAFGVNGVVTGGVNSWSVGGLALDSTYLYVAATGYVSGTNDWYIEKRRRDNGNFETSFGTNGFVVASSTSFALYPIVIDSTYMYLAGYDGGTVTSDWRIEKRRLDNGAGVSSFGVNGVVTGSSTSKRPFAMAIDSTYMYVVGYDESPDWRIEKRRLDNGAGVSGFGTNGVVTGLSTSNSGQAMAIDSTYMYLAGADDSGNWRIEKRRLDNGAEVASFGVNGVVTGSSTSDTIMFGNIPIDSTYMYLAGSDDTGNWRIEKRRLDNGAGDASFGTDGVVTGSSAGLQVRGAAIDSVYVYLAGYDDPGDWRIEKRRLDNGALDSVFGTNGVVTGSSTTWVAHTIVIDSIHMYVGGNDADSYSRVEKRTLGPSGATWAAAEDQPISNLPKQTTRRLRFEISNEGTATSSAAQYRLEYSTSPIGSWTQIGTGAAHWVMAPSIYFTDGASTTDVSDGASSALTNENADFEVGQIKDVGSQTAGVILTSTEFTELEYSIAAAASAIDGQTYYFRLTDTGTTLDTYRIYASATLAAGDAPGVAASGTLISQIFDTGNASGSALNSIMWQGFQPAGTAVKFQIAAAAATNGPWIYKGPNCTVLATDTYDPIGPNIPVRTSRTCHNNNRYFRYKITLEADVALTSSPRVDSVILNWSR